jgi:TM2 domain-containing membrane protein YozV
MSISAQTQSLEGANDLFSAPNRLKFGNHLFQQKDYLRAVDEYLNYLRNTNNDTVRFKIAWAYQQMGQYNLAQDYFKGIFFSSNLSGEAKLEYYRSDFISGNFQELRNKAEDSLFLPEEYKNNVYQFVNASYLLDDNRIPPMEQYLQAFKDEALKQQMKDFYLEKKNPEYKSPLKAALLSSFIPGLGKIYTENYTDGITAFLLNGLLGFLAYDNFNADHPIRGAIFSAAAAIFYGGNIYGSASSAKIYNAEIDADFHNNVESFFRENNYLAPKYEFIDNE